MQLNKLIKVAKGDSPVDLLLRNVNFINVVSGEIYPTDIAIVDQFIAGIGTGYSGRKELDLTGLYAAPGFIDGHVHIESSMVTISQFARAVVPLGTTSVIADPHEIANVMGYEGIRFMMESAKYNPLNVFFYAAFLRAIDKNGNSRIAIARIRHSSIYARKMGCRAGRSDDLSRRNSG